MQGKNGLKVNRILLVTTFLADIYSSFSGTETFCFDPMGKIVVAFAEWEPSLLAAHGSLSRLN